MNKYYYDGLTKAKQTNIIYIRNDIRSFKDETR